jgi:hypothetical protein
MRVVKIWRWFRWANGEQTFGYEIRGETALWIWK